jgi:hypothetical protein
MTKAELLGMKELPAKLGYLSPNPLIGYGFVTTAAISFVANHGMFQPGQVNADLMCATGFQFDIQERESFKSLAHPVD